LPLSAATRGLPTQTNALQERQPSTSRQVGVEGREISGRVRGGPLRVEDHVGLRPVEKKLPIDGFAVWKGEPRKVLGSFDWILRHGRQSNTRRPTPHETSAGERSMEHLFCRKRVGDQVVELSIRMRSECHSRAKPPPSPSRNTRSADRQLGQGCERVALANLGHSAS
jgi:hypothetical protein